MERKNCSLKVIVAGLCSVLTLSETSVAGGGSSAPIPTYNFIDPFVANPHLKDVFNGSVPAVTPKVPPVVHEVPPVVHEVPPVTPEVKHSGDAISTYRFVDSVGVNTHLNRTDGFYGNVPGVIEELKYLGVRYARDTFSGHNHVAGMKQVSQIAGVKYDIIFHSDYPYETQFSDFRANSDIVEEIEGPNEVDNWKTEFLGQSGFPASKLMQRTLYRDTKLYPATQEKQVNSLSLANASSLASIGDLSEICDKANIHSYAQFGGYWGAFSYPSLKWSIDTFGAISKTKPRIVSETGWWTAPAQAGVPEMVQAKFMLNLLFNAYSLGASRTYIYQLNDEYPDPNGTNIEKHFGLFHADGTPKKAADAIHNLIGLIGDNNKNFVPGHLNYSLSGLPSSGHQLLLHKSNNHYVLVLWNEVMFWDNEAHIEKPTHTTPVSLSLGSPVDLIRVYDPLLQTPLNYSNPLVSKSKTYRLEIEVPDHPVLVFINP